MPIATRHQFGSGINKTSPKSRSVTHSDVPRPAFLTTSDPTRKTIAVSTIFFKNRRKRGLLLCLSGTNCSASSRSMKTAGRTIAVKYTIFIQVPRAFLSNKQPHYNSDLECYYDYPDYSLFIKESVAHIRFNLKTYSHITLYFFAYYNQLVFNLHQGYTHFFYRRCTYTIQNYFRVTK